ncbi:glycosyltransferase family 9 protein, partial [Frankia sp. CcWB2]
MAGEWTDPARAEPREILFVELLGGFGDLLIALPAIHALANSHPNARIRVLTFAPAGELLTHDDRITEVVQVTDHRAQAVREAVVRAVSRPRADLVVTTTRHSGVPAAIEAGRPRHTGRPRHVVTDLWRRPDPAEPIGSRFVRLLTEDGWIRPGPGHPDGADARGRGRGRGNAHGRVALTAAEVAEGERILGALDSTTPDGTTPDSTTPGRPAPVLLVPDAGMAVKRWPAR